MEYRYSIPPPPPDPPTEALRARAADLERTYADTTARMVELRALAAAEPDNADYANQLQTMESDLARLDSQHAAVVAALGDKG